MLMVMLKNNKKNQSVPKFTLVNEFHRLFAIVQLLFRLVADCKSRMKTCHFQNEVFDVIDLFAQRIAYLCFVFFRQTASSLLLSHLSGVHSIG